MIYQWTKNPPQNQLMVFALESSALLFSYASVTCSPNNTLWDGVSFELSSKLALFKHRLAKNDVIFSSYLLWFVNL